MTDQTVWCERALFPVYFGFCPSEAAWKREMRRLQIDVPYPDTDGRMTTFTNADGEVVCIVTVNGSHKQSVAAVAGIFVHEAMHVWQTIIETMGEKERVSREMEAYSVQYITQELMSAFVKTGGRIGKGRK